MQMMKLGMDPEIREAGQNVSYLVFFLKLTSSSCSRCRRPA